MYIFTTHMWNFVIHVWNSQKSIRKIWKYSNQKKNMFKQPTLDSNGNRIDGPEELAVVWKKFLNKKFSPTELENLWNEFEALPVNEGARGGIGEERVRRSGQAHEERQDNGVRRDSRRGMENSTVAKDMAFKFLSKVWSLEERRRVTGVGSEYFCDDI